MSEGGSDVEEAVDASANVRGRCAQAELAPGLVPLTVTGSAGDTDATGLVVISVNSSIRIE
jgi:hypothetical protein